MKTLINRLGISSHSFNLVAHILAPLGLCVVIIAFQYRELLDDRQHEMARAQLIAHDLGSTLAISIAGSLENIDLTLQSAADQVSLSRSGQIGSAAAVDPALQKLQQRVPSLLLLLATDASGNIIHSSLKDADPLSDRDYFQELKKNPSTTMMVSNPLRSRMSDRWTVVCARRMTLANGEFAGIVAAWVDLDGYLDRLSGGQIKLSTDDIFLLRNDEGVSVIRYAQGHQDMDAMGTRFSSENLTRLENSHADSGVYVTNFSADHIERIYYYQRIKGRPMNLVVGISVKAALAQWQKDSSTSWLVTGTFLLAILLAGYLIYRSRQRQIQAFKKMQYMQTQLEQTNLELARLSTTDGLTGLSNRRRFDEIGPHEWLRAMRNREPLAVAMLDVDFFKIYNDRYGHQAGDQCLTRIARALANGLRDGSDFIARYGGEEFVILLPGQDAHDAYEVLERLRADIEALAIPHEGSTTAPVITFSAGYAAVIPEPGITLENLLEQADQSLYAAKRRGKNQVVGASENRMAWSLYRRLQVFGA